MNWTSLTDTLPTLALEYGLNLVAAIAIFVGGKWLAERLIGVAKRLMERRGFDPTVVGFVANIAFVILVVLVIIAALSQLGIPTAQFIAIIGAAGLAIGLALQGSLSNFASGVLLVSFRPARVGDYIEAAGTAGTVSEITVFSTTLITPDKRTITVPNSKMLDGPLVNYTTSAVRRLELVIGISYGSDVDRAIAVLQRLCDEDPRVLDEPAPVIGVLKLADSSVNIALRPHVANTDYWPLHFDMNARIKQAFDAEGIGIPFPQMDVHLDKLG